MVAYRVHICGCAHLAVCYNIVMCVIYRQIETKIEHAVEEHEEKYSLGSTGDFPQDGE